jgi:hypothetical protein
MSKTAFEMGERALEAVFFAKLDEKRIQKLRVRRKEQIAARTSGGFLGIGEISHAESQTLQRLAEAMEL